MASGRLNVPAVIQKPVAGRGATGEPIISWVLYHAGWAEVRELPGVEQMRARQITGKEQVRVRMRWYVGVTPEMRVVIEGEAWNIRDVDEGEPGYMTLLARRAT